MFTLTAWQNNISIASGSNETILPNYNCLSKLLVYFLWKNFPEMDTGLMLTSSLHVEKAAVGAGVNV